LSISNIAEFLKIVMIAFEEMFRKGLFLTVCMQKRLLFLAVLETGHKAYDTYSVQPPGCRQ
jgi:hypothetical protein